MFLPHQYILRKGSDFLFVVKIQINFPRTWSPCIVHRHFPLDRSDCGLEIITLVMSLRRSEQVRFASSFCFSKEPDVPNFLIYYPGTDGGNSIQIRRVVTNISNKFVGGSRQGVGHQLVSFAVF